MTSIPESAQSAQTDTGGEVILGVDTHADQHVAALLTTVGALVATATFPASGAGYRALLRWACGHGPVRAAGVEGTGSYGVGPARQLRPAGVRVIEVNRPDRAARRRGGNTDAVDAEAAARAVLDGRATVTPKTADGPVETLRLFKLAKDPAVKARTQAINQLKAVPVGAPAPSCASPWPGCTGPPSCAAALSCPTRTPQPAAETWPPQSRTRCGCSPAASST